MDVGVTSADSCTCATVRPLSQRPLSSIVRTAWCRGRQACWVLRLMCRFLLLGRLAADQGDNPVALQEALIEMEKDQGPSHWIGSKIPASISSSKIWRTVFWVCSPLHRLLRSWP